MKSLGIGAAAAIFALVAAQADPAAASDTRGFMMGLDLGTSHIDAQDESSGAPAGSVFIEDTGAGASLLFGWGFTPSFALRLNASGGQHDTSDPDTEFWLNSGTLEAMYLFRNPQPVRPFVLGGVGGFTMRSRRDDLDFETTGPGVVLGAGLVYFAGERFAFDFEVRGDFINWDEATATLTQPGGSQIQIDVPIEEEGSAAKFLFGVNWWFGRGE
ncbi:MAG: outer membrane beta-barrel protein [Candidatus Eiseniibacteriota bacterium]